jgi:hypothetical protein
VGWVRQIIHVRRKEKHIPNLVLISQETYHMGDQGEDGRKTLE